MAFVDEFSQKARELAGAASEMAKEAAGNSACYPPFCRGEGRKKSICCLRQPDMPRSGLDMAARQAASICGAYAPRCGGRERKRPLSRQ